MYFVHMYRGVYTLMSYLNLGDANLLGLSHVSISLREELHNINIEEQHRTS